MAWQGKAGHGFSEGHCRELAYACATVSVEFVSVQNVPICGTGEYRLACGTRTFSEEDLAAAVAASRDPTVPAPRIKLGHTDERFSDDLDGEPAFGTLENLRLAPGGQELVADLVDVPEWLASSMQSAFPGRSVEGGFGFTAASGRKYDLAITALALLGTTWPGISSLDDLREVLERNGQAPEPIAAGGDIEQAAQPFVARIARTGEREPVEKRVAAGIDLGAVRQQFCGDLDDGEVPPVPPDQPQADDVGDQMWWWPRSIRVEDDGSLCLIVDDDEGHLIRIPFTVTQGDLVYGQPELVLEQYVPVTSDPDEVMAKSAKTLMSWPIRAASRPSNTTEVHLMDVDTAVLRKRLGLAEDADDAAIQAALEAEPQTETETEPETKTETVVPDLPEGMKMIDEQTLAELRHNAEQGAAVAARLRRQDRDEFITAAIGQGKLPGSRRSHYEQMWDADEEGAREVIAKLEPGLVPAASRELGRAGDGENDPDAAELGHDSFMARFFPNESRRAGGNRRVTVRQEA